jgi:hypothetical protein
MQKLLLKGILVLFTIGTITYIFIEFAKEKKRDYDEKRATTNTNTNDNDPSNPSFHETEKKLIEQSKKGHLEKVFFPSPLFSSQLSQFCNQENEYKYTYQFADRYRTFSKKNISPELDKYRRIQLMTHKKMEKERLRFSDQVHHDSSDDIQESFSIGNFYFDTSSLSSSYIGQEAFNPFDQIGKGIKNIGNKMKGDLSKAMDPLKEIVDFVNKIKKAFESIPQRVDKLNRAFKSVGYGIEKEFESIGKSIHIGVTDVFSLIGAAGECGKKFVQNFNTCIFWYLLNLLCDILYGIFVELPIFILRHFFGVDVSEFMNDISSFIRDTDELFKEQTSFHFLHFPVFVIDKCYSCDISGQINKLHVDFNETIPNIMNEPNQIFQRAKSEFNDVLK